MADPVYFLSGFVRVVALEKRGATDTASFFLYEENDAPAGRMRMGGDGALAVPAAPENRFYLRMDSRIASTLAMIGLLERAVSEKLHVAIGYEVPPSGEFANYPVVVEVRLAMPGARFVDRFRIGEGARPDIAFE